MEHVAKIVADAAGSVALIGDPDRLGHLGLPVFADELPSCGPASGIYTALRVTETDWNLVLACDMPARLRRGAAGTASRAGASARNCIAAVGPYGQPEPLCAVYHRRCLPALARAIRDKRLKMRDLIKEMGAVWIRVDAAALVNVNTPAEWAEFEGGASPAN